MSDNTYKCECYQVGGPWIAEDPECPIHGHAQIERTNLADDILEHSKNCDDVIELRKLIKQLHNEINNI